MQQSSENKGEELAKKESEIKKKLEAIWTIDPKVCSITP